MVLQIYGPFAQGCSGRESQFRRKSRRGQTEFANARVNQHRAASHRATVVRVPMQHLDQDGRATWLTRTKSSSGAAAAYARQRRICGSVALAHATITLALVERDTAEQLQSACARLVSSSGGERAPQLKRAQARYRDVRPDLARNCLQHEWRASCQRYEWWGHSDRRVLTSCGTAQNALGLSIATNSTRRRHAP